MKLHLAFVLLMAASCFAAKARYDNYKLYSMTLNTEEQAKAVVELQDSTDSYDFWSEPSLVRDVDVMVPPHKIPEFEDFLTNFNIEKRIKHENIQELVDQQDPELTGPKTRAGEIRNVDWTFFNTFAEINAWLDQIVSRYPNEVTSTVIGTSHQGRPIRSIRISRGTNHPTVFIEANIHAREWASSATATYIINALVTSTNSTIRSLTEMYDFHIIPVANPDGFVFSHESTRLWRKTRQSWGLCTGTDPNRNFDFFWMSGGASSNPCSETYAGPNPFSEPETAAIRDYYGVLASRCRLFLSFHSFGQYLLIPYGHTTAPSTNHANMMSVGTAAGDAIRNTFGMDYLIGSTSTVLYTASGASPDWAFGVHNTRLAYTYEFRPIRGSSNGFLLPPAQIIPNSVEVLNGIVAMIQRARELGEM